MTDVVHPPPRAPPPPRARPTAWPQLVSAELCARWRWRLGLARCGCRSECAVVRSGQRAPVPGFPAPRGGAHARRTGPRSAGAPRGSGTRRPHTHTHARTRTRTSTRTRHARNDRKQKGHRGPRDVSTHEHGLARLNAVHTRVVVARDEGRWSGQARVRSWGKIALHPKHLDAIVGKRTIREDGVVNLAQS